MISDVQTVAQVHACKKEVLKVATSGNNHMHEGSAAGGGIARGVWRSS